MEDWHEWCMRHWTSFQRSVWRNPQSLPGSRIKRGKVIGLIEKVKVIGLIAMNASAPDNVFLPIANGICPFLKCICPNSSQGQDGKLLG